MRRETKRDEVHESVRCCTLDSPHGPIQGLSQARRKAGHLELGRLEYGGYVNQLISYLFDIGFLQVPTGSQHLLGSAPIIRTR